LATSEIIKAEIEAGINFWRATLDASQNAVALITEQTDKDGTTPMSALRAGVGDPRGADKRVTEKGQHFF
jgi:hypothetical protein